MTQRRREIQRGYGFHEACGGQVLGTHHNGIIHVRCSRCGADTFSALSGRLITPKGGSGLIAIATQHWLELHGECSGEIYLHESSRIGVSTKPRQIRRIFRCRTHGTEFRIEV